MWSCLTVLAAAVAIYVAVRLMEPQPRPLRRHHLAEAAPPATPSRAGRGQWRAARAQTETNMTNQLQHLQLVPRHLTLLFPDIFDNFEVLPAVLSRPSRQLSLGRSFVFFRLWREGTDPASRGSNRGETTAAQARGVA
jgi:hypothetical protein